MKDKLEKLTADDWSLPQPKENPKEIQSDDGKFVITIEEDKDGYSAALQTQGNTDESEIIYGFADSESGAIDVVVGLMEEAEALETSVETTSDIIQDIENQTG